MSSLGTVARFGAFEVDLCSGELLKDGLKVKLQGQPIQVLTALLEHPSEIVTREELRQRLWPSETFVDFEHNLNSAVKRLRRALGPRPMSPALLKPFPGMATGSLPRSRSRSQRARGGNSLTTGWGSEP